MYESTFLTITIFFDRIVICAGTNRRISPTPGKDVNYQTLIMKRVSLHSIAFSLNVNNYLTSPSPSKLLKENKISSQGTVYIYLSFIWRGLLRMYLLFCTSVDLSSLDASQFAPFPDPVAEIEFILSFSLSR